VAKLSKYFFPLPVNGHEIANQPSVVMKKLSMYCHNIYLLSAQMNRSYWRKRKKWIDRTLIIIIIIFYSTLAEPSPAGFWFSACESNFAFWHSGRFPSVFLASRVCAGYRQLLYSAKTLVIRVYVGATAKFNARTLSSAVTPVFMISFRILGQKTQKL
jgi:hypothetical protein